MVHSLQQLVATAQAVMWLWKLEASNNDSWTDIVNDGGQKRGQSVFLSPHSQWHIQKFVLGCIAKNKKAAWYRKQ